LSSVQPTSIILDGMSTTEQSRSLHCTPSSQAPPSCLVLALWSQASLQPRHPTALSTVCKTLTAPLHPCKVSFGTATVCGEGALGSGEPLETQGPHKLLAFLVSTRLASKLIHSTTAMICSACHSQQLETSARRRRCSCFDCGKASRRLQVVWWCTSAFK